jgi:hypothetical protein
LEKCKEARHYFAARGSHRSRNGNLASQASSPPAETTLARERIGSASDLRLGLPYSSSSALSLSMLDRSAPGIT